MFRFIVSVITGGLVMWYRNRTIEVEFAENEMIGTRETGRYEAAAIIKFKRAGVNDRLLERDRAG